MVKKTVFLILFILTLSFSIYVGSPYLSRIKHNVSNQYVDYKYLEAIEDYLIQNEAKKADIITADVLFRISGRTKKQWLGKKNISMLPCQTILVIEDIWSRNSEGIWGFRSQNDIWKDIGGQLYQRNLKIDEEFKETVGWGSETNATQKGFYPQEISLTGIVIAPYMTEKLNACEQQNS